MFKKLFKFFKYINLFIFIFFIYTIFSNYSNENKFLKLKKYSKKINMKNICIIENLDTKTYDLYILNKFKQLIKFKNLNGIGRIENNKPIILYKNNKFGCINFNGEVIQDINLEYISNFNNGLAIIKKGKFGLIKDNGKIILPLRYDAIYLGKNNKCILKLNNLFYGCKLNDFNNINLKLFDIDDLYKINDTLFVYLKNNKFGILTIDNEIIIPNEYDEISFQIGNVFIGKKNEKYSIYNLKNEKVSKDFDYIEQLDIDVYSGGSFHTDKIAFLSPLIQTEERYINIFKCNSYIYIGKFSDSSYEVINLQTGLIINMSKVDLNKFLKNLHLTI